MKEEKQYEIFNNAVHPYAPQDAVKKGLPENSICFTLYYIMNTLTIRIPDKLRADLKRISRQQDNPVSDIVRESARRYVAIERFRSLRKKVLPFAEAQGLVTDEDIFKAMS